MLQPNSAIIKNISIPENSFAFRRQKYIKHSVRLVYRLHAFITFYTEIPSYWNTFVAWIISNLDESGTLQNFAIKFV